MINELNSEFYQRTLKKKFSKKFLKFVFEGHFFSKNKLKNQMEAVKEQHNLELIDQDEDPVETKHNEVQKIEIEETKEIPEKPQHQDQIHGELIPEQKQENLTENEIDNQNEIQAPVQVGAPEQPVQLEEQVADNQEEAPKGNIIWRSVKFVGVGLYHIAYSAGEFLADLFGITRPRYAYALREYEERERRRILQERMERGEVDEFGNEIEQPNTA